MLRSDGSVNNDGWYVDDIKLSVYSSTIPVELVSFTASTNKNNVTLYWKTATELNNKGFEIERSLKSSHQNLNWQRIGFVDGNGTTTEQKEYSFTDEKIEEGSYLYRLKQIDLDGSFIYSQEIEADVLSPNIFELSQNFPNPFNPVTTIKYQLADDGFVSLKVFDVLGSEIKTLVNEFKNAGYYEIEFNASNIPSGVYFYKIQSGNFNAVKKMILNR